MGDSIYNVYTYLLDISKDKIDYRNLKKEDITPAITFSIFDTKGKVDSEGEEIGDGVITKEEFDKISKEDYDKYCMQVKEDIKNDPQDPLEMTKKSVQQYAIEEGIYDEEYIKKLETQLKAKTSKQQEDLTHISPISYDAVKKYIEKHGSIDYDTLRNKEIFANKTISALDKNNDNIISKNENKFLYRKNKRKSLNSDDVISFYLNFDEQKAKEKLKIDL